jgi:hypothetical protein
MQLDLQLYLTTCGSFPLLPSYGETSIILCDNYGLPLPIVRFVVFPQPAQTRGAAAAGSDKR